jgi:glycerol-3-phosphate dehydrogenase
MGEDLVEFLEKENLIEKIYSNQLLNLKLSGSYHFDNIERNYTYQEEKEILENLKNFIQLKFLLDRPTTEKLVFNYGFNAIKVLDLGATNNTNVKLIDTFPLLESQIIYSIRHEMAIKPNDIICRRIGVSFLDEKLAYSLIERVTQIMGKELKWNSSRIKKEVEEATNNMKYFL